MVHTHKNLIVFSFFSQSLQPKPDTNPPQIPVSSHACPKSKKNHRDATGNTKNSADNPIVKKVSKGKSSEAIGSNPPIPEKPKNSEDKDTNSTQGIHDSQTSKNATKTALNPVAKLRKSNLKIKLKHCDAKDADNSNIKKVSKGKSSESNGSLKRKNSDNTIKLSKKKEDSNTNSTQDIHESYEEQRLRNISERKAKFDELKLKSFKLSALDASKTAPNPYYKLQKKLNPPISKRRKKKSPNINASLKEKEDKNTNSAAQGINNDPQTSKSGALNPYFKGRLPNLETKLKGVISEKKRDELKIRHYVQKTISKLYICPVCNKPDYDGGILWIQCDVCNKWYHYECVGLDKNFHQSEKPKDWFCDDCSV